MSVDVNSLVAQLKSKIEAKNFNSENKSQFDNSIETASTNLLSKSKQIKDSAKPLVMELSDTTINNIDNIYSRDDILQDMQHSLISSMTKKIEINEADVRKKNMNIIMLSIFMFYMIFQTALVFFMKFGVLTQNNFIMITAGALFITVVIILYKYYNLQGQPVYKVADNLLHSVANELDLSDMQCPTGFHKKFSDN